MLTGERGEASLAGKLRSGTREEMPRRMISGSSSAEPPAMAGPRVAAAGGSCGALGDLGGWPSALGRDPGVEEGVGLAGPPSVLK